MKSVIVSSLKGGIGKTFLSLNLAETLSKDGTRVGLFDCDIDSSNLAEFLGVDSLKVRVTNDEKFELYQRGTVQYFSMSLLARKTQGVSMSGDRYVQIISDVLETGNWLAGTMIFDLPAGASDVFKGVVLQLNETLVGGIIVALPQTVVDLERLLSLHEHYGVPVLGVIENLAYFKCEHGKEYHVFGKPGKVKQTAEKYSAPYLGSIPLLLDVPEKLSAGEPAVINLPVINKAAEIVQEQRVDRPRFLQRIKERIVKIARHELERIIAEMIKNLNKFDIKAIQQQYHFTKGEPFSLVLQKENGELLVEVCMVIKNGRLKVIPASRGTRIIVTDASTLARVLLGRKKSAGKFIQYTPLDAVLKNDIKIYGAGSTGEMMKVANHLFSGPVIKDIRERNHRILKFLAGE